VTNFFQAVGIVVILCVFILVFVGVMYISYILAIGVLLTGAVAGAYYFLKALKTPRLDI